MTNDAVDPDRIDDETSAPETDGTAQGSPVAGVRISEEELDHAVEPDDKSIDGPPAGHA